MTKGLFGYEEGDIFELQDSYAKEKRILVCDEDGEWVFHSKDGRFAQTLIACQATNDGLKTTYCTYKFIRKGEKVTMGNKFYKVLSKNYSSIFGDPAGGVIKYELNKVTYPVVAGTYLFIFDDLELAKAYAKNHNAIVCECEVEGLLEKDVVPKHLSDKGYPITSFPKGTRFAYGVTITKLIDEAKSRAVLGRKWFFISYEGDGEIWEEDGAGYAKCIHSDFANDVSSYPLKELTAKGLDNYKLNNTTSSFYLTQDESEFYTMTKLIKNQIIKLC